MCKKSDKIRQNQQTSVECVEKSLNHLPQELKKLLRKNKWNWKKSQIKRRVIIFNTTVNSHKPLEGEK